MEYHVPNAEAYDEYLALIESAQETTRQMVVLAHAEGGIDELVETEDGLNIWQGLCTDLFDFLKTCDMIEGAALIHKISRHGRLSFTKIIPFIEEPEGDLTLTKYREYLRSVVMIPDRVESRLQEIRVGREDRARMFQEEAGE